LVQDKFMGDGWNDRKVLIYSGDGNVNIINSTFKGNGEGEGMVIFGGEASTTDSYFENIPDAIEYILMNKGLIRNNFVTKSPDDAIDLNACNNILVEQNILIENSDKAISIGTEQYGPSLKNIVVQHNLIIKNKSAISIKDSSVARMSNNTLFKNTHGIRAYKKREDYLVGGAGTIKNTIFEKNTKSNAYPDEFSTLEVKNSMVHNKVLAGKNNFKGDPQFIDASKFNFHLKANSPAINKGDDGKDIGAFNSTGTTVNFSKVHVKSAEENNTGDWISLQNNYNVPVDLSLYKIILTSGEKEKVFVFPIGTTLKRLSTVFITNKYKRFIKHNATQNLTLGNLPKLKTAATSLTLLNPNGIVIDFFTYNAEGIVVEDITYVSNNINDNTKRKWRVNK
jgi:hypothetical protein